MSVFSGASSSSITYCSRMEPFVRSTQHKEFKGSGLTFRAGLWEQEFVFRFVGHFSLVVKS